MSFDKPNLWPIESMKTSIGHLLKSDAKPSAKFLHKGGGYLRRAAFVYLHNGTKINYFGYNG